MSENGDICEQPRRKRGVVNEAGYKRNKIKVAKVKGLEHVNYSGKIIPAKTVGPACKCPYKCFDRIRYEDQL